MRIFGVSSTTMYAAPGIGLAAPQVGVSKRVIVVDVSTMDEELPGLIPLVNPEITQSEGEIEFEEGCLSLPGFTAMVKRAGRVCVRALDSDGKPIQLDAEGILAIALQHEMDHLEGTLLLDRTSPLRREFYKKKVKKSLAKAG
jgi:peptide deformylase